MKDFIFENWKIILTGIVILLEILNLVIKKRDKTRIIDDSIFYKLMGLIIQAEQKFKNGEDKLKWVIEMFKEQNPETTRELIENGHTADDLLKPIIEYILSSPQKKGTKNGKKNTR